MESFTTIVTEGGKLLVYCIGVTDEFMMIDSRTRNVTEGGKLIVYCIGEVM
jgi:hypothetical protein